MNPLISLCDLVDRLESAEHTIAYFNTPLPEPLFDGLRLLAGRRGRGSVDLVVEQIDDVAYLKKLNFAGASVYNGVGLPRETLVIVDRIQGYWLATDTDATAPLCRRRITRRTSMSNCSGADSAWRSLTRAN